MKSAMYCAALIFLQCLICGTTCAQAREGLHLDIALNGVPQAYDVGEFSQVDANLQIALDSMLDRIDLQIADVPWDVALRAARCRAILDFAYSFEYSEWVDDVYKKYDECLSELGQLFPEHAEVVLLRFQGMAYQEQIEAAAPYVDELDRLRWTAGQKARFYTLLATAADYLGDVNAGIYAARALNADANAGTRLIFATNASVNGDNDGVRQALVSPVERIDEDDLWSLANRLPLLSEIGEHDAVLEIYDHLRDSETYYAHREAADALIAAGEIELAREELAQYEEFDPWADLDEFERFSFEYRHGSPAQALTAYNEWRDLGWTGDFLGINRIAVQFRDFTLPWQARDWLFIGGFLITASLLALSAALPISFVHYRGLIVRARSNTPYPGGLWQLRHAWQATFLFGMSSVIALYFSGPALLTSASEEFLFLEMAGEQLANVAMIESVLTIVLLMPLARLASRDRQSIWRENWSLPKALLIGMAVALVLRIPFFVFTEFLSATDISEFTDSALMQMLTALRDTYGTATAYWMVVLLAPVVEEFVFRGVLLKSFSKHISATGANAFQALLFALAHMEAQQIPYLFVVGFVAGVLAKRSGGLAAPIAMHAVFNLILAIYFF